MKNSCNSILVRAFLMIMTLTTLMSCSKYNDPCYLTDPSTGKVILNNGQPIEVSCNGNGGGNGGNGGVLQNGTLFLPAYRIDNKFSAYGIDKFDYQDLNYDGFADTERSGLGVSYIRKHVIILCKDNAGHDIAVCADYATIKSYVTSCPLPRVTLNNESGYLVSVDTHTVAEGYKNINTSTGEIDRNSSIMISLE